MAVTHPDLPFTNHPNPTGSYYANPLSPSSATEVSDLSPKLSKASSDTSSTLTGDSPVKETPEKSISENNIPQKDASEDQETPAPVPSRGWRFYAAFFCLCIVNFVCAIDSTSLSVALPIVAQKLHGTAIEAFWAGTSFLLTSTVFQPTFASLSHVFGRKPVLLLALTLFTAGSIIGALANNFTVLLVGRTIQGVGGGGIQALTYVIVCDIVTLIERGKWFGLITLTYAIGTVIGPVIGGTLAERASWRWIFWINLPFCGFGFAAILVFLRLKHKEGNITEKIKNMDWVGSFIFVGSMTSFLIPITWGGIMYPWNNWRTFVPLVVGAVGLIGFVLWSTYLTKVPILRGSMFKNGTALSAYFGTIVHGMFLWSILYYLPIYFQAAKGMSPTNSGIALFPWTFTTGPSAAIVGILIARTGRYRRFIYIGWVLTAAGIGLLMLYKASTPTRVWVPLGLVSGLGTGFLYSAQSFAIQAAATDEDLPFAAALYSFLRAAGQMLGVAVGGAIFQNELKKQLLQAKNAVFVTTAQAYEYSRDASALVEVVRHLPAAKSEMKMVLVESYVDALRILWLVMCVLAGVALISSVIFIKKFSLQRGLVTDQGFVEKKQEIDSEQQ